MVNGKILGRLHALKCSTFITVYANLVALISRSSNQSIRGFSGLRVLLGLVLGSFGVFLALMGFGLSSGSRALAQNETVLTDKVSPEVLADTAEGRSASIVIFLADQADLSAAYAIKDQDQRGWFVYNTLTQHATQNQAGLKAMLAARSVSYQSFWVANMIVATADRSLVDSLALRGDVARIDSNRPTRWIEDPEVASFEVTPSDPDAVTAIEWGVTNVNAPGVWALGFTGQGMVIGDLDTGMRWTHAALKPKYRGWNGATADHNFNWHDSIHSGGGVCGPNTVAPCDDHGHGTHTAGTTVGDDGSGNQVGVAPGAKWIGCRNMDQGNGTPATYTECFQFMIAPTDLNGNNANPSLRPHVLNNSWGCPMSEGCTNRTELETIVSNTQAAGIFVEVSAGNSGPSCSTVSDPPAIYSDSFSTGAISITNTLASFSSRGPSTYYTPNLLKPNVSAPGVNVRSSYLSGTSDTTYSTLSGTSMAGPHVCGVIALLWSARPQLVRDIANTKAILQTTANPSVTVSAQTCAGIPSTQIPNNSFGWGRVDALAAVNSVPLASPTPTPATPTPTPTLTPSPSPTPTPTPMISISGTISYCSNPVPGPVPNVTLTVSGNGSGSTASNGSGNYTFSALVAGGTYTITPSNAGLTPGTSGIDTVDVVAIQRHFLNLGTPLSGCRLTAADVNSLNGVDTVDVVAVQRFFLGLSTGIANTGKYQFNPTNRTYSGVVTNQTSQNYGTLIFGDVANGFIY